MSTELKWYLIKSGELLRSDRDHLLMDQDSCLKPRLTVELYLKHYNFYITQKIESGDTKVIVLPHHTLVDEVERCSHVSDYVTCLEYKDNVVNPELVFSYCEKNKILISDVTCELLVGRWERDVKEKYPSPGICEMSGHHYYDELKDKGK